MPVGGLETPPQSKPPLPPKPARLHRRLTDTKVEDHSLDESDDSDDDDDMEGMLNSSNSFLQGSKLGYMVSV
jgi:hypothetical protein